MDRYEFDIKIEQIKKLMKKKDFATAVKIADSIEWKKVKENPLLIIAADVYEISGKYDDAREVLLLAYEKTGLGRQLAYRLCRLSVKRGDFKEAEEFYDEFTHNSPYDAGKYILQYEMAKGKGESLDVQIGILETFIGEDMDDRWAYELAKLYHKAHLSDKCVELCDTIILWFADGKYVEKALELKQLYVPLSENQRLKYEAQISKKDRIVAAAVQDFVDNGGAVATANGSDNEETVKDESSATTEEESVEEESDVTPNESEESEVLDQVHEVEIDVNSIRVKDFSVSNSYDTINIQKELAKSVSTLFDNTIEIFKPVAPKNSTEEEQADDQIEGQMSLEEVLAMFESGELGVRSEDSIEESTEEPVEELVEEEIAEEETIEEELEELTDEEFEELEEIIEELEEEEFEEVEDIEDDLEEVEDDEDDLEEVEDIEDELEEVEDEIEEAEELVESGNLEELDEVEALSQIIAKEIQAEIAEEIADVIEEAKEEKAFNMLELDEEMEEVEEELDDLDDDEYMEELDEEVEEELEEVIEEYQEELPDENENEFDENISDGDEDEFDEDISDEEMDESEEDDLEEDIEESEEEDEADVEKENEEKKTPASNSIKQADIAKIELKKFISKFTGIKGLDKQILKVLQTTLKVNADPVKFIFVKGEIRSGKTTLAIEVIKVINRIIQRKDQKIAKIKGISINDKSVETLLEKLDGSDILIERVSDMDIEVFIEFVQKLKEEGKQRVVIFEDEKTLAEAYLEELPEEFSDFSNVIDIKLNEIRDWATIAENYAKQRGYSIDAMGTLALSAKIDQLRAVTLVIHKSHIEQLIDEAILDAEKFSIKKLFGKLFGKKDSELKPLTEKNFIK